MATQRNLGALGGTLIGAGAESNFLYLDKI